MRKTPRKKDVKQKLATKVTSGRNWGFDYGLSFRAAAIGSINFNEKLRNANIIGVAYGIGYSDDLDCDVPFISLVGTNEEPLQQAFEEFAHWAKTSDADAIDVTLVFLNSGGYRLMINPEPIALIHRALKYDAIAEPISFLISWIKPIDTLSEPLRQLRLHLASGIKPFILSASVYTGIVVPGKAPMPGQIRIARNINQLLKFKIRFADEGTEAEKDYVRMALLNTKAKSTKGNAENKAHLPSPESLMSTRINRLKTIFPVTLWRADNIVECKNICNAAEQFGLRNWQVQQALCNSLVSREMVNGLPHFEGIKQKDWPNALVVKLAQRYEMADGKIEPFNLVTPEELAHQAMLDAGFLLNGWGLKRIPDTIEEIQKELDKRNLLDRKKDIHELSSC